MRLCNYYVVCVLSSFASMLNGEERAGCFVFVCLPRVCSVALPYGTVG